MQRRTKKTPREEIFQLLVELEAAFEAIRTVNLPDLEARAALDPAVIEDIRNTCLEGQALVERLRQVLA